MIRHIQSLLSGPCLFLLVVTTAGCNVDGRAVSAKFSQDDPRLASRRASGRGVDMSIVEGQEVDLVEAVAQHRGAYHEALMRLKRFYESRGYMTKVKWAETELRDLGLVKQFRYMMDAEVAAESLRPTETIAEADQLLEQGLDLMRRGGHGVPGLFRRDRMVEAAETFRTLIEQYPTSDKIDDAAFYCGEIHKEYLPGEETIAVKWYERCWTWNPETPHPARFQAAVVHDYRLHDRDKALELYRAAVQRESQHAGNTRFASSRISELTGEGRVLAAPPGQ